MTPQILGSLLAAGAVLVVAYRLGRTQAAWEDARASKRSLRHSRRTAWAQTIRLTVGTVVVLLSLTAAAYDLAR
jgi:hypothetical protein